ncbi:MAG: FAD-dependent oxidoreductase, partial [Bacilli bacterium]|nr:FAD-dependent oxidoreductase [Bacilli bacterium]
MVNTDILIIGAGPAGISAALYLARANASFVWLEKSAPGGKLLNIHEVGNYPGIPNANGFDLAMSLLKSTESLGVSSTYGEVKNVHKEDGRFITVTEDETYSSLALIVATGLSNVPTIPGEKDLFGKGVSYCATCDGPLYRGKTAVIYGKGFQALEEALYLQAIVGKLCLITPEEEYEG